MVSRIGLVAVLVWLLAGVAVADDVAEVQKKIVKAWMNHKSSTADIEIKTKVEMDGRTMEGLGTGQVASLRKGDEHLLHMDLTMKTEMKMGEQTMTFEHHQVVVIDGQSQYVLEESMGRKQARKDKIDPQMSGAPELVFADLEKDGHTFKVLPDEKVGERDCYAIEATPKEPEADGHTRLVLCFDKEHGIVMRTQAYRGGAEPVATVTMKNVKVDVDIDPKRFKFELPEGVELLDRTEQAPPTAEPQSAAEPKPSPE